MKRLKILLSICLLFTFLSLLIFWPVFLGKVNLNGNLLVSFYAPYGENLPYKNSGWDQLRIYFPFYKITLDAIKNLEVPLWNPYAFSGHPHMADFQTAVFYPLNIFGLILGQIEFWHLLRITPSILAAFFTFLYLRSLGLVHLAAIFGAVTFGFSPFILTWGEEVVMSPHSIVWLPLILWAIERFLERLPRSARNDHKKYLAIIALATAASFFGGYMQTSIYMFIFVFSYLVFKLISARHPEPIRSEQESFGTHGRRLGSGSILKIPKQVRNDIKQGLVLIGAVVLGVGIAAVQLLPSAELFFNAARSEITLKNQLFNFLLPIESLFTYLAPDFFGHPATHNFFRFGVAQYYEGIMFVGVAALIFAAYMLYKEWNKWLVRFLAVSGVVALATTIDWFGARIFLSLPIPFLSTSIPNRVLFLPAFCLAVLAAGGFEKWVKGEKGIFRVILALGAVYIAIGFYLLAVKIFNLAYFEHAKFFSAQNMIVTFRNLVIPVVVFLITSVLIIIADLNGKLKNFACSAIVVVSFLHIFYFSQKYFSFSERERIFPQNEILSFIKEEQGLFRSWGVGEAFLENNFASQYAIFWPEGYDSLNNRSYGEFTYAMQGARVADFVFRADAGLGRGNTAELIENPARRRLIDMVGVKYVIGKVEDVQILGENGFRKVFESGKYAVFENLTVMPRAFLASNYEGPPHYDSAGQAISEIEKARRKLIFDKLLHSDFDWRNMLILEVPSAVSPQFGEGVAEIVSYKPQEVVIKTKSDQPKLLFLSDNWYPGWKATVDGDQTPIWRANYTFRAIPLIAGEHEVRFYYDSEVFKLGLVISAISLLALAWFTLARSRLLG